MANTFHLEVVTPMEKFFEGDVEMVVVRTSEGDDAYMHDHILTNAILGNGIMKIRQNGQYQKAYCEGGFVKVNEAGTTIVTKSAEWRDDVPER